VPIYVARNEPENLDGNVNETVTSHGTCHGDAADETTDEIIADLVLRTTGWEITRAYVPGGKRRSPEAQRKAKSRQNQREQGIRQFNAPVREEHYQQVAEAVSALGVAGPGYRLAVVSEELAAVVQELEDAVRTGKGVHIALAEAERKRRPPSTETEKAAALEKRRAYEIGSRALAVTGWRRNLLKLALSRPPDQTGAEQSSNSPPASAVQISSNGSAKPK
jgi:hypothetical protein